MSDIVDHLRDDGTVTKENGFTGKNSNIPKKTTKGCKVLIEWNHETTTWVDNKDVKEASQIEFV